MNTHELNSAELNGSFSHNIIVGLGPATAAIEFMAYERSLAFLSGSTGIGFSALGDITKYSQIGQALSGITFTQSAALSAFTEVNIPSGSSEITFDQYGALYTQLGLPYAVSSIEFSISGSAYLIGHMAGETGIVLDAVASESPQLTKLLGDATADVVFDTTAGLTQYIIRFIPDAVGAIEFEAEASLTQYVKNYIPAATAPISFDVVGDLTQYGKVNLSGYADMSFVVAGDLQAMLSIPAAITGLTFSTTAELANHQKKNLGQADTGLTLTTTPAIITGIQRLSGNADLVFSMSGNLLNNPTAIDPPAYVLTRPFVDRVMVRQS